MTTQNVLLTGKILICWAVWCATAQATAPFFMGLGDLPGGTFLSEATGVSADGSVVVGTGNSALGNEAFRWTADSGMLGLGAVSTSSDVSADGAVVVGQWGSQAFRRTHDTGFVGLGDFPGGLFDSIANAVSADGSVIVGRGARQVCTRIGCRNFFPAFRWTQSSGLVAVSINTATDISADGSVIVGGGSQAARWTEDGGGMSLGDLPGGSLSSFAWGVSADGSAIVGYGNSDAGVEAFRWTDETGMVGLGVLPGFDSSVAHDVSADGSVVVGSVGFGVNTYAGAFIWDATHGMRNLRDVLTSDFGLGASLAGWSLDYTSAISADGRVVVGYGTNPSGNTEAWIARLEPMPALPGDYNDNGTVDAADYTVWRDHLRQSFTLANESPVAATPGLVDAEDYDFWKANFGKMLGNLGAGSGVAHLAPGESPGANYGVPEPASLVLCGVGIAARLFTARCRRSGLCRPTCTGRPGRRSSRRAARNSRESR